MHEYKHGSQVHTCKLWAGVQKLTSAVVGVAEPSAGGAEASAAADPLVVGALGAASALEEEEEGVLGAASPLDEEGELLDVLVLVWKT
jgi:hypothetical protein